MSRVSPCGVLLSEAVRVCLRTQCTARLKGWTIDLGAGEKRELRKTLPMRDVSIRRHYPGEHRLALQVNGMVLAQRGFVLEAA